jgi:Mrp family chromosome partitioning ATPase
VFVRLPLATKGLDPLHHRTGLQSPRQMGNVIAVANQKGGVGKSTTALSLGHALHEKRKQVLLVDLDSQAHLTLMS